MISFSFINSIVITKYVQQIMVKMKSDLFYSLFEYKIEDYKKKNIGDYISLFNNDIEMIENDYVFNIFQIYSNILGIVLQIIVALFINVRLTLLVMFIGFLILLFPSIFTKPIEKRREELLSSYEKMNGSLNNYLNGFQYIKISQMENTIAEKWNKFNQNVGNKKYRFSLASNFLNSILRILSLGVIITILVLGSFFVVRGSISVGSLVAILQLYSGVFQQAGELAYKINNFSTVKPIVSKLETYLKHKEDIKDNYLKDINKIEFQNVDFSYDGVTSILKDVNLSFQKGKSYAIIGDSASGKSTLIGMILQTLHPTKGKILIDGKEYQEIKPIYEQAAYISQDIFMFNDTLQFNLFLTDEEKDIDVEPLFEEFELNKFLDIDFKQIVIKEGATNISGGEKQRLSIIRELLKKKPILLMDEATSNVNSAMSAKIYSYLLKNNDAMLISVMHNYTESMLEKFDYIIHVEDRNVYIR